MKIELSNANNVTNNILNQYNKWVNLKNDFEQSAIGEISNQYMNNEKKNGYEWEPINEKEFRYNQRGRYLLENFDPQYQLAQGKSYLQTVNNSIYETESQINYYEIQLIKMNDICLDFTNLYDNFYLILIGIFIILLSSYLLFSVHCKYFSVWNYEVKLIKNEKIMIL